MRADIAVEPTKSENITVTWRRSADVLRALCGGFYCPDVDAGFVILDDLKIGNCAKQFAAVSERDNSDLLEVLIGQIT